MCLIASGKPYRTTADIKAWKIVKVHPQGVWTGPWGYNNRKFRFDRIEMETGRADADFEKVGEGFFHSYVEKDRCESEMCSMRTRFGIGTGATMEVCRCTIPAGSLVIRGCNGDVASNRIIVESPLRVIRDRSGKHGKRKTSREI